MNMLADAGREIPAYAGMTWLWGWSSGCVDDVTGWVCDLWVSRRGGSNGTGRLPSSGGLADNVRACPCSSGGESSGFLNRARRFESGQGYHAGTGNHVKSDWRAGHTTWTPRPPRMERTTFLAWST